MKVLIADDASFVRDLVKRCLRNRYPSLKYEEATQGRRAVTLLQKTQFDLILCDWEMPEMSGVEVLQWCRGEERYAKTPFVMITSRTDRDHILEAIKLGVTDYLGKPFSEEQLVNKINKALGPKLKQAGIKPAGSPLDGLNDSASVLSAKPVKSAATPAKPAAASDSAALLTGAADSAKPAPSKSAAKAKALAQLRVADGQFNCVVRGVDLTEIRLVAKRGERLPALFEQAVVDIEFNEGESVARLNAYIHSLQANEKHMAAESFTMTARFVDDDPDKLETLSKFIASM